MLQLLRGRISASGQVQDTAGRLPVNRLLLRTSSQHPIFDTILYSQRAADTLE